MRFYYLILFPEIKSIHFDQSKVIGLSKQIRIWHKWYIWRKQTVLRFPVLKQLTKARSELGTAFTICITFHFQMRSDTGNNSRQVFISDWKMVCSGMCLHVSSYQWQLQGYKSIYTAFHQHAPACGLPVGIVVMLRSDRSSLGSCRVNG